MSLPIQSRHRRDASEPWPTMQAPLPEGFEEAIGLLCKLNWPLRSFFGSLAGRMAKVLMSSNPEIPSRYRSMLIRLSVQQLTGLLSVPTAPVPSLLLMRARRSLSTPSSRSRCQLRPLRLHSFLRRQAPTYPEQGVAGGCQREAQGTESCLFRSRRDCTNIALL